MNLKDFFANRENPPELYWSLVIESGWVQAGVWYIGENAAEVVSVGPGAAWEVEDELIGAVDAALSSAIQKLPEDSTEPSKTVFGVSSSWVENGEISEEYLAKIKKLCGELSLAPVGFVVLPEAIAHLYKSEEGAPLSAVILGLGKEFLEISVFKLGNLSGTTQVARSVSLIEDVTEGLSRFEGAAPLPSRFIVYDGKGAELSEAKEALMQETWEAAEKINFLHTPKVETLASERKVLATSLAGANEIGQVSSVTTNEAASTKMEIAKDESGEIENVARPKNELSPVDLGFALGEDVTSGREEERPPVKAVAAPISPAPSAVPPATEFTAPKIGNYLMAAKGFLREFSRKFFGGEKSFSRIGIVVALVVVVLGLSWWFLPTAKVTIYVSPKTFQEEVEIKFNAEGKSDPGAGIIPAETVSVNVSGGKTKATSGTKTVGDKAKGSVQIQNGTAFPINLTAGTFLVSSGNLKFAMDASASVSAALSPSSPGTANLSVTADSIGAEYNLAKDEIFRVGNYPKAEVDATAVSDFSGGSSQQIAAVSKEDASALETQLKDELAQSAKDQLREKVAGDRVLIDDLADISTASENFDHKVGDSADNLKLSLTIGAMGIAADKNKLMEYARSALKDKIPSGFALRDSQIGFKFVFESREDGNFGYKTVLSANFLPQVDTTDIVAKVVGKTPSVTQNYLSSVPGFTRAQVTLNPSLPGFLGTLPHVGKNITVEIVAER